MTITHADLQRLFSTRTIGERNAIELVETVKMLARGKRVVHVYNATLAAKLGWNVRTIQRAKAECRRAGIPMHDEVDKRGSKATAYVLDRSWIPALGRPTDVTPGGDTAGTPSMEEKTLHLVDPASLGVYEVKSATPRGSPAPPGAAGEPAAENDEGRERAAEAAPLEAVPGAAEALDELRRRWGELGQAAAGERGAHLRRLSRHLVATGTPWPAVLVAQAELARELHPSGDGAPRRLPSQCDSAGGVESGEVA